MAYTHTTLAQAKTQLAARLRDTGKLFWVDAELGKLINESLYTWQSLTGYWRERGVFNTTPNTLFYNLISKLPTLLGYNLTTRDSITSLQYSLLEPPTPIAWTGTSMYTLTDLTTALQNRRNQFLVDTNAILSTLDFPIVPPPIPRQVLPDTVINIARAAYKDVDGNRSSLFENLEFNATAYDPDWAISPATPDLYSVIATPPVTIQLIPPPNDIGTLELVIVQAPNNLDPTDAGNLVNVPDNFEWVLRWGVLADLLLREGESHDPVRGQYALSRYNHGIKVAIEQSIALQWEINGVPVLPSSVEDHDVYDIEWHNNSGTPDSILTIGQNLIAVNPLADIGPYSITVDLIRNAIVPTNDADFIQVGRQDLETILGYAEHLAAFKLAGTEFLNTMPLLDKFISQASAYNSRLSAINSYVLTTAQSIINTQQSSKAIAELKPDTDSGA